MSRVAVCATGIGMFAGEGIGGVAAVVEEEFFPSYFRMAVTAFNAIAPLVSIIFPMTSLTIRRQVRFICILKMTILASKGFVLGLDNVTGIPAVLEFQFFPVISIMAFPAFFTNLALVYVIDTVADIAGLCGIK
jgi:hypothetical protein